MIIVPYEAEHFYDVSLNMSNPYRIPPVGEIEQWRWLERVGDFKTGIVDGRVVAVAGVLPIQNGVGKAITYLADCVSEVPVSLTRHVLRTLVRLQEREGKYWRVYSDVAVGFDTGVRWIEYLGFEREGIQRGLGENQEDYYLYARVRKWQ